MPTPTTCRDTFNAARAQRAKYPLTSGLYKLREVEHAIEDCLRLVKTIADRLHTGSKFGETECLGPCMADERGTYLKSIPARLAERIGYDILPAIAALEGDGVPKAEVQRLLRLAETDARRLIAECEALRLRLKGGIEQEYRVMRQGESMMLGPLKNAQALAKIRYGSHSSENA